MHKRNILSYFIAKNGAYKELYVDLNLCNENYSTDCSYNPEKTMINNHLVTLEKFLDLHSTKIEVLISGDFNVGVDEQHLQPLRDNPLNTSVALI